MTGDGYLVCNTVSPQVREEAAHGMPCLQSLCQGSRVSVVLHVDVRKGSLGLAHRDAMAQFLLSTNQPHTHSSKVHHWLSLVALEFCSRYALMALE